MKRARLFRSASLPLAVALAIAGCVPGVLPVQTGLPPAGAPAAEAVAQEVLAAGIVKGRVKAYDFATKKFVPVGGASIVVEGTNFRATTDAQGFYTLTGVAKGEHKLVATKQGLIKAEAPIHVNGVLGIADVDMAMGKPGYGLQQATALLTADMPVYGVVRDPRGCAVPNSTLFVTATSGRIESSSVNEEVTVIGSDGSAEAARVTTTTGFYIFTVKDADDFTRVTISASGRTRGGIPLERARTTSQPVGTYAVDRTDVASGSGRTVTDQSTGGKVVTGAWSQGFDIQLNKFVGTRNPVALGDYVTGGQVKIRVPEGLSSRPDEFFVRIRQGNEEYDIVPIRVEAVSGSTIARDVTFRLPSTLSTLTNFNVAIMQLGIMTSAVSPWLRATAFTEAEFRLVTLGSSVPVMDDVSTSYISANISGSENLGHFIDGEWAELRVPVRNNHPRLNLNMALVFDTPGVSEVTATLERVTAPASSTTLSGMSITPAPTSVASTKRVAVPFTLPPRVGNSTGPDYEIRVRMRAQVPSGTANFRVTNLELRETSLSYVSANTATPALAVKEFSSVGWTVTKTISNDVVTLTFQPPGGYLTTNPLAALRVIDVTPIGGTPDLSDPTVVGFVASGSFDLTPGSQNAVIPNVSGSMRTASFRVVWSGYTYTVNVVFRASTELEPNTGFSNLTDLQTDINTALAAATRPTGAPALPAGLITVTQPGGAGNAVRFTLGDGGTALELLSAGGGLNELGLTPLSSVGTPVATRTGEVVGWLENNTATGAPPAGAWDFRPVQNDVLVPAFEYFDSANNIATETQPFTVRAGTRRGRHDSSGRSVFVFDLVPDPAGDLTGGQIVATYSLRDPDGLADNAADGVAYSPASPSLTRVVSIAYPSAAATSPLILDWKAVPIGGSLEFFDNN